MNEPIGKRLAAGNVAEIFESDSRVVKLYKSPGAKATAFREAAIHAAVEAMALPVPRLWGVQQFGDRWGLVFDRVAPASFADQMVREPQRLSAYLETMVRLQLRIHAQPAVHFAGLTVRLAANIAATGLLEETRKRELLPGLADMPEGERLCHGDFHPMNILGDMAQPLVIDWADARRGDPAADVARSYLILMLHAPQLATPYLDAYCEASDIARPSVLDWLPYVAAARFAEGVAGEQDGLRRIVDSRPLA
jgi:aminoglycoside phosphotransferase (APT) family kinase protein